MRSGALCRAGDTAEVADIGHAVKDHDQRGLILGYTLQDILDRNVVDSGHLGHYALVISASEAVELLDGHLLPAQVMTHAEVLQLVHELTLGTTLDVEFFDLFVRLDSLDHGAYSEYDVFHNMLVLIILCNLDLV